MRCTYNRYLYGISYLRKVNTLHQVNPEITSEEEFVKSTITNERIN